MDKNDSKPKGKRPHGKAPAVPPTSDATLPKAVGPGAEQGGKVAAAPVTLIRRARLRSGQ
ncbi:hypothetical protein L2Y96_12005 [Luteibacter aegosomaticola]|uniref:hypothetical protein n=1 Tax=Luteibacter aegosomaticola TaxID=2911538 RepID=UPI001FF89790|nr:hypothetical protein [Luteibacter aegosomaticola]UPG88142.1 hypothetical protein L2Y96_12005 [Luteibacter aegosomaticola]